MRVKSMDDKCEFCKSYWQLKEFENIDKQLEEQRPMPHYEKRYFAQLVTRYWNSKYKQYESWIGYDTVELKYCPLCGKKLKG